MTDDRIKTAQDEIQTILPPKPEYVVNTSEFNDVKGRLAMLHNRRNVNGDDPNRPRLRRAPGSGGPVDDNRRHEHQDRFRRSSHPEAPR